MTSHNNESRGHLYPWAIESSSESEEKLGAGNDHGTIDPCGHQQ
jgi:hypothetical protein